MKLLILVDDYLPESKKVAGRMMHELALCYKKIGHDVTVLTPSSKISKPIKNTIFENVNVIYFKSGKIKGTSKVKRAINESLLPFVAWLNNKQFFKQNKYDAIIYYSPSIFWGLLVGKLKKLWNIKSYLILRDIFPQWAIDNNLIKKNSLVHIYFNYFEQINYKHADIIGVMSPSNIEYFREKKYDLSKFDVLYNWSVYEKPISSTGYYRAKLGLKGKIVFFYGGNIGHAQNMINLIRLAKKFKDNRNIHFLFVGEGDEVDFLLSAKQKNNLDNVTYIPSVTQKEYFEMLAEFDIGLFSLHPNHKTHNFPGKLLGYMTYSKPILGSVNKGNDLKDLINNSNSGYVFINGDDTSLYEAANRLAGSETLRREMGENGNKLLKSVFSVEKACNQIINKLK